MVTKNWCFVAAVGLPCVTHEGGDGSGEPTGADVTRIRYARRPQRIFVSGEPSDKWNATRCGPFVHSSEDVPIARRCCGWSDGTAVVRGNMMAPMRR